MSSSPDHADELAALRERSEELDRQIAEQSRGAVSDFAKIRRLREEKRGVMDRIAAFERTPPDIIA